MPTYKNTGTEDLYMPALNESIESGGEFESERYLPPHPNISLVSETPYIDTKIVLSQVISGGMTVEIPFNHNTSFYTISIVGQGGVAAVSFSDPDKFYAVSDNVPFLHTVNWISGSKITITDKIGAFQGIITVIKG